MAQTINTGEKRRATPTPADQEWTDQERTDDEMEAGEALLLLHSDNARQHNDQQHQIVNSQTQGKTQEQLMNGDQRPHQNMAVAQTAGRTQRPQHIPQPNPNVGMATTPAYQMWNANGLPYMQPGTRQAPVALTGQEALQAYLIRQQILAGVAPENLIMMGGSQQQGQQPTVPPLLQITNQGVFAPNIPPAAFNGVFNSYPVMAFQPNVPRPLTLAGTTGTQVPFGASGALTQAVPAQGVSAHNVSRVDPFLVHQRGYSQDRPMIPQAVAQTYLRPLQNGNVPTALEMTGQSANPPSQNRAMVPIAPQINGIQPQVTHQTPARRLIGSNASVPGTEQTQKAEQIRGNIPGSQLQPRRTSQNKAESSISPETTVKQARHTDIPRIGIAQNSKRRRVRQPKLTSQSRNERLRRSSSNGSEFRQASFKSTEANQSLMSSVQQGRKRSKSGDGHRFSILKSFVRHPALAFMIIDYLEIQDVINLHLTFRRFYSLVKNNLAIIIMRMAAQNAFQAMRIFPFACYYKLCDEASAAPGLRLDNGNYMIPSFRWLQMILYREMVIHDIMNLMIDRGWDLPEVCVPVLKKLWFLMDIPDNKRRFWTIQNRNLWSDTDLILAAYFIAQLDLLFMSHHAKKKMGCMRRLLMAQPSFALLWEVLRGTALTTHHETLKAYVRWQHNPDEHQAGQWLFGVPPNEIGSLQWEEYGRRARAVRFRRPDDLVLNEIERRKLEVQRMYVDIILCEKIDPSHETCTWPDEAMKAAGDSPWLQAITLQW